MKLTHFLSGIKILEETHSEINGGIQVVRDLTWGTYIKVGGLTQSGGILFDVWQSALHKLQKIKPEIKNCLILGLGGGSVAVLVHKYWPEVRITGVDIDPKMVEMGKKYLGLEKVNAEVIIIDAEDFVKKVREKFDLVLVDMYCGDKFPEKFESEDFIKSIRSLTEKDGISIFNRLYGPNDRRDSVKFAKRLEKLFKKVDYVYPQANLDLICYR